MSDAATAKEYPPPGPGEQQAVRPPPEALKEAQSADTTISCFWPPDL